MRLSEFLDNIGHPIAYYPQLTKYTGSSTATLLLCQIIYWRGKERSPEGWLYKTQQEIEAETGLTRYEQETARKKLIAIGLLEEKKCGLPRKLHYRANLERLEKIWEEKPVTRAKSQSYQSAEKPHTRVQKHPKQGSEVSADNIYTETTSKDYSQRIQKRRLSVSSKTLCDTSLSETSLTSGDASKPEKPESLDINPVPDQSSGVAIQTKNKDTLAAIPPKKKNLTYDEHGWLQLPTKHKNYKLASKLAIRRMQIVIIFDILEDFEVEWQDDKPYFNSGWDEGFENEFFAESTGQALRALRDYGAAHHDLSQDWYNDRLEELFLDSVECCVKKGVAWVSKVLDDGMVFAEFNDTDTEFESGDEG
jgi:hypothetical protein